MTLSPYQPCRGWYNFSIRRTSYLVRVFATCLKQICNMFGIAFERLLQILDKVMSSNIICYKFIIFKHPRNRICYILVLCVEILLDCFVIFITNCTCALTTSNIKIHIRDIHFDIKYCFVRLVGLCITSNRRRTLSTALLEEQPVLSFPLFPVVDPSVFSNKGHCYCTSSTHYGELGAQKSIK